MCSSVFASLSCLCLYKMTVSYGIMLNLLVFWIKNACRHVMLHIAEGSWDKTRNPNN